MEIYGKIKKLCEQNNIKITELEKALNIGHRTFYNWKTGSSPSVDKLKAVADYFGVTVNDFLYDQEEVSKCSPYELLTDKNKEIVDILIRGLLEKQR